MTLRIDIRNKALRGGRITLDAKTDKKVERNRREAMVRHLLEHGELDIIEGIRTRVFEIADVYDAYSIKGPAREREMSELRRKAAGLGSDLLLLGPQVEAFLKEAEGALEPKTLKNYRNHAQQLVTYFGADFPMASLLASQASAFLTSPKASMDGKPWGAGSQRHAKSFAQMLWKRVIADEADREEAQPGALPRLTRNPWGRAKWARYRAPRVEFLRPEEWVAVREAVRGRASCALLALGCRAGLRFGEVANLRTGIDVDMDRRLIMVRQRSGRHAWKPKNDRGERDVPMPDDLYEIMVGHMEHFAGRAYVIAFNDDGEAPISHSLAIKWTRSGFNAAGIKYGRSKDALTFHSLRHTFASWLTQQGMHPKKVARLLGDTPEMVLKVYGHLAEDDHDEAVALLNRIIPA